MDFISELFGVAGKSVLVTGGRTGIGLAIAEGFARAGARVYISSRDADACMAAAEQIRQFGSCTALPCNIASSEGRENLLRQLKAREDSLDVLVNNAGALWAAPLAEYPESGWDKVFDLNVKGVFFLIQQFMPMLEAAAGEQDPARVIIVGSANAIRIPTHETYAYVASKAAVHQLARHLAGKLAGKHITSNVIAPGLFPSNMQVKEIERRGLEALTAGVPLGRLGAPADMAGAAIYLASKAGAYLTGAVISVDGGMATTV